MGDTLQPKRRRVWRIVIVTVIVVGGVLLVLPPFIMCGGPAPARSMAMRNACINNLRQIEAAKEQWSLEKHKDASDGIMAFEIDQYIKGGHPNCPAGGTYSYGKLGENPACTIQAHKLDDLTAHATVPK
jgi:hypothetical protein